MDILTIALSVLRQWYITVPVVLGTLAVAVYVGSTIPPQYQASGQVLLVSPDLDPSQLPRSSVDLGQLAGQLATDDVQAPLLVGDASIDVTVGVDSLTLVVTSDSPANSTETTSNVASWLDQRIEAQQEEAGFNPVEWVQLVSVSGGIDEEDPATAPSDLPDGAAAPTGGDGSTLATTFGLDDPAARVVNPFGASNQTVRILAVAIQSDRGRTAVAERTGPGVTFTLSQDIRDAASIMTITTVGAEPEAVLEAFDHVAAEVASSLSEREARAEVPPTRRTRIEPIAAPQTVTDVSPPLDRSVAAIIGLGGLLAIGLAIAADSLGFRWARGDKFVDRLMSSIRSSDRNGPDGQNREGPAGSSAEADTDERPDSRSYSDEVRSR